MDGVDPVAAAALGFPKPDKYVAMELERRWLCRAAPPGLPDEGWRIEDLYLTGARLRLRRMTPLNGGEAIHKLTRKADLASDRRLVTTIYLDDAEHALLAGLPGRRLAKTRRHLAVGGQRVAIDVFDGALAGLVLAEVEFVSDAAMRAFSSPAFADREVTDDPAYTGGALSRGAPPRVDTPPPGR